MRSMVGDLEDEVSDNEIPYQEEPKPKPYGARKFDHKKETRSEVK